MKSAKNKTPRLVLIEWIDSASSVDPGWKRNGDIADLCHHVYCRSTGWIMHETKESLTIVGHLTGDDPRTVGMFKGDLTIPKVSIMRRVYLDRPSRDGAGR